MENTFLLLFQSGNFPPELIETAEGVLKVMQYSVKLSYQLQCTEYVDINTVQYSKLETGYVILVQINTKYCYLPEHKLKVLYFTHKR